MSALLAAALNYAGKHLPVFPCQPRGKTPAVAGGFHAATTNAETIKRYWRIADRNIGIPTGSVSGVWILDVDGEDGEATPRGLQARLGALPQTREVITGGGRHLWFKYTGPIPSTADTRIGAGLHTRGAAVTSSRRRAFTRVGPCTSGRTPPISWRLRPTGW
jgi:hypothetical protein